MKLIACIIIGYFIGSINPAYIIGKLRGVDVRKSGSKNAGASNIIILFGKVMGLVCALIDIAKPCFSIWLASSLFAGTDFVFAVTATSCILGHMYPWYMKFHGGKGLACLGGAILTFDWRLFMIMLTCEIAIVLISDYLCFVPITASVAFPIMFFIMTGDIVSSIILVIATVCIISKHIENLVRIKNGVELKFSFLWKRDEEIGRLKERIDQIKDNG